MGRYNNKTQTPTRDRGLHARTLTTPPPRPLNGILPKRQSFPGFPRFLLISRCGQTRLGANTSDPSLFIQWGLALDTDKPNPEKPCLVHVWGSFPHFFFDGHSPRVTNCEQNLFCGEIKLPAQGP